MGKYVFAPLNSVDMRGRVGSHEISLREDGRWEGQFDLYVPTKDSHGFWQPLAFDCHVAEDGKAVKNLGAGIGGKIVNIRGRILPYDDRLGCYIRVERLTVVGNAEDMLKVPDPPKTEEELKIEKGVLF